MENGAVFSKKIQRMFTAIAPWYDFLNRLLSLGQDQYWRKTAVDYLEPESGQKILDLATGTADVALDIASRFRNGIRVYGVDFSRQMLLRALAKTQSRNLESLISFQAGKGEELPFASEQFHGAIVAFGIRNFFNIQQGLKEICRVLRPGHRLVILEFSIPRNAFFRRIYLLYFQKILPWIGEKVSRHENAYHYLPRSVKDFPGRNEFVDILHQAGFEKITLRDLTWGIATLYIGHKSENF